jgi:hypothetical protein
MKTISDKISLLAEAAGTNPVLESVSIRVHPWFNSLLPDITRA